MYATIAHKETAAAGETQMVQLSNAGMSVYEEFDRVVVLSKTHRLTQLNKATTDEQRLHNARCVRFAEIQLRMRDMTLTSDDYLWLCKLKRSARSAKDRLFFKDAVTLMEFKRTTDNNEKSILDITIASTLARTQKRQSPRHCSRRGARKHTTR